MHDIDKGCASPGKKRKVLKQVKIGEVSLVAAGANPGALQTLVKTAGSVEDVAKSLFADALKEVDAEKNVYEMFDQHWELFDKLREVAIAIVTNEAITDKKANIKNEIQAYAAALSTMVDDAELSTNLMKAAGKTEGGKVFPASDYAYTPDKEKPSTWKLRLTSTPGGDPDPRIVGAAIAALGPGFRGQKVQIPAEDLAAVKARVKAAWKKANPDKEELPEILKSEDNMSEELQKKVDELLTKLAAAELRAGMTDVEKKFFDGLIGAEQEAFGKSDSAARAEIIKKAAEADEVVNVDGVEMRKSAVGEAAFKILKSQQAKLAEIVAKAEAAEAAQIQKSLEAEAEKELPHLPGDVVTKALLLKSIKAMPAEVQTAQMAILKAADEAMAKNFKEIGQTGTATENTASENLNKKAEEIAKSENISIAKAYAKVLETPEGAKLYAEAMK